MDINWTQIAITLASVFFGASGAYGVFLAHRRVMRAENNENQRINRIITDERVDVVWQQTLELFTAERERTRQDFAELREALAHETSRRREVEVALSLVEAELRAEQEARRRLEAELAKERQERQAEKEQTMRQIAALQQENASLRKRLLVQEKKDKQL